MPTSRQPLPDIVRPRLSVLFVGINPGLRSAELGHHFAGRSNRFWKLLYRSGITPEPLGFADDRRMLDLGYGLTNIVDRATRSVSDLSREEFAAGRVRLARKIGRLRPRWVAFTGVTVYRVFFERSGPIEAGLAPARISGARVFILPNPSGRNAHYPYPRMLEAYRAFKRALERRPSRREP
jgi:double-stranded uracil-DNA glycosylase